MTTQPIRRLGGAGRLLSRAAGWIPARVARPLARALALRHGDFALLGALARSNGFSGLVADGTAGQIRGSLDDRAALWRYAQNGQWAPHDHHAFTELFSSGGGTYVDIGANIGLTVIPVARNPLVECVAFEPHPENFRYLRENVAVNCGAGNVRIYEVALFHREGILPLEISEGDSGDHRLAVAGQTQLMGEAGRRRINVRTAALDSIDLPTRRPFGVKIDTQGAEPFVIQGGQSRLGGADLLAIEFWPYSMKRMSGNISGLLEFFGAHFKYGSATRGDANDAPRWQSVGELVAFLACYAETSDGPLDYLDVLLRK